MAFILGVGSQQPHINKEEVDDINFVMPSEDVLLKYYEKTEKLYEFLTNYHFDISDLSLLRDKLIPQLLEGHLTTA